MRKDNQCKRILEYMREHGSITPMECFLKLRITKLATRIGEMIRSGIPIHSEWVTDMDDDGNAVRYKRYWLVV